MWCWQTAWPDYADTIEYFAANLCSVVPVITIYSFLKSFFFLIDIQKAKRQVINCTISVRWVAASTSSLHTVWFTGLFCMPGEGSLEHGSEAAEVKCVRMEVTEGHAGFYLCSCCSGALSLGVLFYWLKLEQKINTLEGIKKFHF